jgi:periplasmic protein TonB
LRELTERDPSPRLGAEPHGPRAVPPALHNAAARWREPVSALSDQAQENLLIGNVIAFRRPPRDEATAAPAISFAIGCRPAPAPIEAHRVPWWLTLLAVSATAHLGLYLPFQHAPTPMASIGEVAVSVELVLGADQHAGLVPDQGTSQASAPAPAQAPEIAKSDTPAPPEPVETARVETAAEEATAPPEVKAEAAPAVGPKPAAPAEESPDALSTVVAAVVPEAVPAIKPVAPIDLASEAPAAPAPVQAVPQTEVATTAELQVSAKPVPADTTATPERPTATETPEEPGKVVVAEAAQPTEVTSVVLPKQTTLPPERPEPRQVQQTLERERPRTTVRERRPQRPQRAVAQGERNRSQTTTAAAAAAGGVGRGRSDANTNYRGLVAAHLARHKRFPDAARSRGSQGSAVVTFALDGGGRVTSVRVARGSGVTSLDQEAAAMVRRASPFPAPPSRRGMSFTVPVSFRLN